MPYFGGGSGSVSFPLQGPNGGSGNPSYSFSNFTTTGLYASAGPNLNVAVGGSTTVIFGNTAATSLLLNLASPTLTWASGTLSTSNLAMVLSGSQAVIGTQSGSNACILTGATAIMGWSATGQGSLGGNSVADTGFSRGGTDAAIRVNPGLGTAPTISSGFGTSPSIVAGSSNSLMQINVGTGGTATSGVVAFHGTWTNAPLVFVTEQSSLAAATTAVATTTQITFTTTTAWPSGSILSVLCLSN